jgi:hypothetical protein
VVDGAEFDRMDRMTARMERIKAKMRTDIQNLILSILAFILCIL